jgi:hypothetical protein
MRSAKLKIALRGTDMAVKHIEEEGKVHKGQKGGKTGCGIDTTKLPSHWVNTNEKINCEKDGCKN